jgi:hypothetical protein
MNRIALAMSLAFVVSASTTAQQTGRRSPYPRLSPESGVSDQVISPAVVASYLTSNTPQGTRLDLLVLWRGAPGWFLRTSMEGRVTGGADGAKIVSISHRDFVLEFTYIAASRIVRIDDREIKLGTANLLLVDDVDRPRPLKIAGIKAVDGRMFDRRRIDLVIRPAVEVHSFLRCDAKLPDEHDQMMISAILCSQLKPK